MPGELDDVVALADRVFRDGRPQMRVDYPLLFNEANAPNLRILLNDQKPVSLVEILERTIVIHGSSVPIGCIGSVCTNPSYRGRGLATQLMLDAARRLEERGADLMLISGGRGLYRRLGACPFGRVGRFQFLRDDWKIGAGDGLEVNPFEPEVMTELITIYQREPVRYLRSMDQFAALCEAIPIRVLRKFGAVIGYLVAGVEEIPKERGVPLKRVSIREYYGARFGVMDVIGKFLNERRADEIELHVPLHDYEMIFLLSERGQFPEEVAVPNHTLKMLNLERLWERLGPYMHEALGEAAKGLRLRVEGEGAIFEYGRRSQVLNSPEAVVGLLFGGPRQPAATALDGWFEKIFPIPTAWPMGLDFT